MGEGFFIEIEYEVYKNIKDALIQIMFFTATKELLMLSAETDKKPSLKNYTVGKYKLTVKIPGFLFNTNNYHCEISIQKPFIKDLDRKKDIPFEVINEGDYKKLYKQWEKLGSLSSLSLDYNTDKI